MDKVALCMIVHDDVSYMKEALASFKQVQKRYVFVSRVPWHGEPGNWQVASEIARESGATVVEGDWGSEAIHRQAALSQLSEFGHAYALIPDSDEVIEASLLESLLRIAGQDLAERVYIEWATYWKTPQHVVRPREAFTPCMMLSLTKAHHVELRHFEGGRALLLPASYGIVHHLSYAGSDERIFRKTSSWGHRDEVQPGWFERVWKGWDHDPLMQDLHPTHPAAYRFVEAIDLPPALAAAGILPAQETRVPVPTSFPAVSVVIPLHGGEEDIQRCLESLLAYPSLLHEVIVVDNASPDGSAAICEELLKRFPRGVLERRETNTGFAAACNHGARLASGDVILFLNSDTVVPKSGLIRLMEALGSSGSIGAAGPVSNNVGHFQMVQTTYTAWETLDRFANSLAMRSEPLEDTDMLVGFCLAVRRSVWHEVGEFDESFGIGTFEDNDLSYRIRRAGYRLVIARNAFVHHTGSKTLSKVVGDIPSLLQTNHARFERKWRQDIELGFASHLSGLASGRIVFREEAKPEHFWDDVAKLRARANVSLCMIVKNEERVLGACLESAMPFFTEVRIADTGSTDATPSIIEASGALMVDFPWTQSFSEARNASMQGATGSWIFWMDADDTLPLECGRRILEAAANAPADIIAFTLPVRFTDEGPHSGVQVDHVKLFRNLPGVAFEGRIHEQIIASLQRVSPGGKIARLEAYVLHSGYDTSEEGQARKRERDDTLLKLDLADRPGHPFVLFNLGMTAHFNARHEEAVSWFEQCLEASGSHESHVRKVYALMGGSLRQLGRIQESTECFLKGLEVVGDDPELHFFLGQLASDTGNWEAARFHYEACLAVDTSAFYSSFDRGIQGFKTFHNLAGVESASGNYARARELFLKALASAPEFLPSAFSLFDIAKAHGDRETMIQMLEWVRHREGQSANWEAMRSKLP